MIRLLILLTACLTVYSCANQSVDTKGVEKKLMQISRDWSRTAATDSIEKTLSYWADDAVVMSPGQPPVKGKNAIRQMVTGTSKIPGFKISWEPLSVQVSKSGDLAYMLEQNQISFSDSLGQPVTEYNKAVTIWRKEADGSWKNIVDIWNSDPTRKK
jgi:uncharacterized protein (TIGR02246 family)